MRIENFPKLKRCDPSPKRDEFIDVSLDPPYFSLDSPFKRSTVSFRQTFHSFPAFASIYVKLLIPVCCAPSLQPPQRMQIASVMKLCSGYELAVVVMNLLYTLPLTSHHNNKMYIKEPRLRHKRDQYVDVMRSLTQTYCR